jgi:hypothetical protein
MAAAGRGELAPAYFDESGFIVNSVLRYAWSRIGEQKGGRSGTTSVSTSGLPVAWRVGVAGHLGEGGCGSRDLLHD